MSKQIEFAEIDFETIEYRNEYRHTKAVFAVLWTQGVLLTHVLKLLFKGGNLLALLGGAYLGLLALALAALFIKYRSRVIITGQGLLLKRPLLKDVEIAYFEIGEVQVNGMVIREGADSDSGAVDLSKERRKWPVERYGSLKIKSRDGKRTITVEQSLESFDRFCDDLTDRWRSAIDRYLGYAKGSSMRQPERYLETLETLKAHRSVNLIEKK